MQQTILSAAVTLQEDTPALAIRPGPGVNILTGKDAESVFWGLAGIFCAGKTKDLPANGQIQGQIQCGDQRIFFVTGDAYKGEIHLFIDRICGHGCNSSRHAKNFHKQRFLRRDTKPCIFDGAAAVSPEPLGESDLLLSQLDGFLHAANHTGQPLFICNFFERLDEAIDLQPIFDALKATGQQCFILLPHYDWREYACYAAIHRF